MNRALIAALPLMLGQAVPALASGPLNPAQQRQVGCVATLAIVASEQQRGVASGRVWPPLAERGGRFAQVVGEKLMAEAGWTKEAIREAILTSVAARQKAVNADGSPQELAREEIAGCIALMDAMAPPPPPPTLPQCAAIVALAFEETHAREGLSAAAKDLKTLASVLDYRARETLRGEGRSGPEVDKVMGETRAAIADDAKRRASDGVSAGIDYGACIEMARP